MKTLLKTVAAVAAAAFVISFMPVACTQPDATRRVLSQNGYTEIQITGWRPFAKSKDELFSTGFRAKTASGSLVTGAVTGGFLKGHTIRLD